MFKVVDCEEFSAEYIQFLNTFINNYVKKEDFNSDNFGHLLKKDTDVIFSSGVVKFDRKSEDFFTLKVSVLFTIKTKRELHHVNLTFPSSSGWEEFLIINPTPEENYTFGHSEHFMRRFCFEATEKIVVSSTTGYELNIVENEQDNLQEEYDRGRIGIDDFEFQMMKLKEKESRIRDKEIDQLIKMKYKNKIETKIEFEQFQKIQRVLQGLQDLEGNDVSLETIFDTIIDDIVLLYDRPGSWEAERIGNLLYSHFQQTYK